MGSQVKDEYQRQRELLQVENRVTLPEESIIKPPAVDEDYDIVRVPRTDDQ